MRILPVADELEIDGSLRIDALMKEINQYL